MATPPLIFVQRRDSMRSTRRINAGPHDVAPAQYGGWIIAFGRVELVVVDHASVAPNPDPQLVLVNEN